MKIGVLGTGDVGKALESSRYLEAMCMVSGPLDRYARQLEVGVQVPEEMWRTR